MPENAIDKDELICQLMADRDRLFLRELPITHGSKHDSRKNTAVL